MRRAAAASLATSALASRISDLASFTSRFMSPTIASVSGRYLSICTSPYPNNTSPISQLQTMTHKGHDFR